MICACAASVSAEAFINLFSAPLVPTAPIATHFSPSPLTIVTPPVKDLSLRKVFQFRASVAPNTNVLIPVLPPNAQAFSVNSFEKQQELHQRFIPIPQLIREPSDIVLRSDIVDGVQTIQTAHESFRFNHGVQAANAHHHPHHHEHRSHHHGHHFEARGFKTYGLPQHDAVVPVLNVPSVHQPEFQALPIQPVTVNLPTEIQSVPEDVQYTVATNPEFTLPIETQPPFVPIAPIGQPASIDQFEFPHREQPTIQPILTLTPPLATPIDNIPVQPVPSSPAIFAPLPTPSPPLIRNFDTPNAPLVAAPVLPGAPTVPESRIESGDRNLYSNEYSSPDGTKVTESGQLFSTADGWENVISKTGSYEFVTPEGITIKMKWIADQRGFRIIP